MTDTYTDTQLLAMPQVNLALLDQTLDYIIEHPDEWDQGYWAKQTACGTTCCFAGWAAALAGHEAEFTDDFHISGTVIGGESIEKVAQRELGLTKEEAYDLFIDTLNWDTIGLDYDREYSDAEVNAARLKAVKVQVERIRYRARMQEQAFARAAEQIGEANSKREVVVQEPQPVKVA